TVGSGSGYARLSIVVAALLGTCVSAGCATKQRLLEYEVARLNSNLQSVRQLNTYLDKNPKPETAGSLRVFLHVDEINQALARLDDYRAPIEKLPGAIWGIDSVRADFSTGFPQVVVTGWARRGT